MFSGDTAHITLIESSSMVRLDTSLFYVCIFHPVLFSYMFVSGFVICDKLGFENRVNICFHKCLF